MRIVCGWCGNYMREDGNPDGKISHGICPACEKKMDKDLDQFKGLPGKDENIKSFHRMVFNPKRKI